MHENNLTKTVYRQIRIELLMVVCFNAVMFYLFSQTDFLEFLYHFSQKHERWELDEVIPLFFTISLSLSIFSVRRWLELRKLLAKVHEHSIRDSLTGLYNRRHMQEMLKNEAERTKRTGAAPFSLIFIDIDHFKQINDTHGHNTGDRILFQFSGTVATSVRKTDTIARWGGEEFIVLCPQTELEGTVILAENILQAIRKATYDSVENITASIGVVTAEPNEDIDTVIHRSDICLYKAKENGRDCIISA